MSFRFISMVIVLLGGVISSAQHSRPARNTQQANKAQQQPSPAAKGRSNGAGTPADHNALKDHLIALEKKSWEAWKKHDGRFFQDFLSEDHVEVGFSGLTNKATVVAGVASPICTVKSYAVDKFELTTFDANTALLTYHAQQDTACNGNAVPSPVWVSSLYLRRGGQWRNALYQQTQTRK
ncbi:MAG: nuclear transport factor 2 family protein [Acidobacteriota bacterium]|nr:nuclear transport factor 2 family protein [Acidobacteriota bacterium]